MRNYTLFAIPDSVTTRERLACAIAAVMVLAVASAAFGQPADKIASAPRWYVPYRDLSAVIDPAAKTVLMDKLEFHKLLAAAKTAAGVRAAQVVRADYTGEVKGSAMVLRGELTVTSLYDGVAAAALNFAQLGLTEVTLDGKPAPLGYDAAGQLVVIVSAKGDHKLTVAASAVLTDLPSGGMQLSLVLPQAVAGTLKLNAAGDLAVHSTAPVSARNYDKATDRTAAELAIGGQGALTAVLLGNGRQDDDRAILLGESTTSVTIEKSLQTLHCIYNVQVLRRGVNELTFTVPGGWTVTDVASPNLQRWNIETDKNRIHDEVAVNTRARPLEALPPLPQLITIKLANAGRGAQLISIQATRAADAGTAWDSPLVRLSGATFQRGFLMIDAGQQLRVRSETFVDARREDSSAARALANNPALLDLAQRLYYHWGANSAVRLELAGVALRRSAQQRQEIAVLSKELAIRGFFQLAAIDRPMYSAELELPAADQGWELTDVRVNGQATGFEYRLGEPKGQTRKLTIELAKPVPPEGAVDIAVMLLKVPRDWNWSAAAAQTDARIIDVPLLAAQADTVAGVVTVTTDQDLVAAAEGNLPAGLTEVSVGKMATLGLAAGRAYSSEGPVTGSLKLKVTRQQARVSADAVALVTADAKNVSGNFLFNYSITRASTRRLVILADKTLGETFHVDVAGRRLTGRQKITSDKTPAGYDEWELTLDSLALGAVNVRVTYTQPLTAAELAVPLVRPVAQQTSEYLAVQASEEIAVSIAAKGASEIDSVELPGLPAPARRILAAYRLAPLSDNVATAVTMTSQKYDTYAIPPTLASSARFVTLLGPQGQQQTQAEFGVANAGMQFLKIRLPQGAQLWSLSIAGQQAKPKRDADGDYLLPIGRTRGIVPVRVVYALEPKGDGGAVELGGVTLVGVSINESQWTVIPPPGFCVASQQSHMETRQLQPPTLAAMQTLRALEGRRYYAAACEVHAITPNAPPDRLDEPISTDGAVVPGIPSGRRIMAAPGVDRAFGTEDDIKTPLMDLNGVVNANVTDRPSNSISYADENTKGTFYFRGAGGILTISPVLATGRYTLPISLNEAGHGPAVLFTTLGQPALTVTLSPQRDLTRWELVGLALMGVLGIIALRWTGRSQWMLAMATLAVATLAALWIPSVTSFANGAFFAMLALLPVYIVVQIARALRRRRVMRAAKAITVVLLAALLLAPASALAGGGPVASPAPAPVVPAAVAEAFELPIIIPYDPNAGPDQSDKVLLSHAQYQRLWQQANPQAARENEPASASLANVRYAAAMDNETMTIVLTADLKTLGKGTAVVPMPFAGLAVIEATLDGKPARLQSGPGGMMLAVETPAAGVLKITTAANPTLQGRKGGLVFTLPMLPAPVMTVKLPQDDLALEAPGIEGALESNTAAGGRIWTLPLGRARQIALRWMPKAGSGLTDRTLSAAAAHDVQVFHWAMIGVSKFAYTFSAADYDRFTLLLPEGLTLTDLTGANLRDYRVVDDRVVEGRKMRLIEARLYRAVGAGEEIKGDRRYELTARWLCPLPTLGQTVSLPLPRTEGVGRESGTVDLRAAGGMNVKIVDVTGGRRSSVAASAAANAGATSLVAQYYWPYRPFDMTVQLTRERVQVKAQLDQLLRLTPDSAQLLVQANLTATHGLAFDASFDLPAGYELLSVIGPAVADHYLQSQGIALTTNGPRSLTLMNPATAPAAAEPKRLHVNFRSGVQQTALSLVLVKTNPQLGVMNIPTVVAVDEAGAPLPQQTGRLAVQPAPALDTKTVSSDNLKPVAPSTLSPWLEDAQRNAVRFAYQYEKAPIALSLDVRKQPTRVRCDVLAALNVQPSAAWYTYRLRYRIEGSPVDRISFIMPTKYVELAAVTCPSLRDVTQTPAEGGTRWTVLLSTELTGVLDVMVNFALPLPRQEQGAKLPLDLPRLAVDAPEGYQAVVAVQNYSGQDLAVTAAKGLAEVSAGEQVRLLESTALPFLQYVGQAFKDDWSVSLELTAVKSAQRIGAVVDMLTLTTTIDRDGKSRTEAVVELQNRSEQFLRVEAPAGVSLWSASVAGEPVRPVVSKERPGEILIPLVKTSPGGLPYEVRMYFAGSGLAKLEGMTTLKPPAIRIKGLPVVRTLWSLRLPGGYEYIRPGGNVSPIAGAGEAMSIALDAKIEQLSRLDKVADERGNDYNERFLAGRNISSFNFSLQKEIARAKTYIADNRDQLKSDEYSRLSGKIARQEQAQKAVVTKTEQRQRDEQAANTGNLNAKLNSLGLNPGMQESQRNGALTTLPGFVRKEAEKQKTELNSQIAAMNEAQAKVAAAKNPVSLGKSGAGKMSLGDGKEGKGDGRGLVSGSERVLLENETDARTGEVLKNLQKQQEQQFVQRQKEIKDQLDQLNNSRVERFYSNSANPVTINAPIDATISNGGIVRQGSGVLVLRGNNSYEGTVSVASGSLQLNATNTYSGGTVVNGGVLAANAPIVNSINATSGNQLGASNAWELNSRIQEPHLNWNLNGRINQPQLETSGQVVIGSGNSQIVTSGAAGLTLRDSVTLSTSGRVDVNYGTLTLDNTGGQSAPTSGNVNLSGRPAGGPQAASQPVYNDYTQGGWQADGNVNLNWRGEAGQDGGYIYVSGSTFSLPVNLPDGQVRLDFVRMGGDAEVTVLAVPLRLSNNLYATGTLLVLLAIVAVLWRFIARRRIAKK